MRIAKTLLLVTVSGWLAAVNPGMAWAAAPAGGAALADTPGVPPVATAELKTLDLPVTRIVLFSSGVGYFEHRANVEGDGVARLMFKTDQINDVLKSLIVTDNGQGSQPPTVAYGANEPVQRALKSFGVDLSDDPALPNLLAQLRGAKVTLMAPDKLTGTILGVDSEVKVVGAAQTQVTEYLINIVTESGIRSIPLESAGLITIADPKLSDELNQALALLAQARDTDRKPVDVRFTGRSKGQIMLGYLLETPVWKTSYRLDLSPLSDKKKPLLQGWAIVENTSDVDWKNIKLTLMSGRPISFIQDLYTPLYAPRPTVVPEMYASLVPKAYDEGIVGGGPVEQLSVQQDAMQQQDKAQAMAAAEPAGRRSLALPAAAPGAAGADGAAAGRGNSFGLRALRMGEEQKTARLESGIASVAQATKLGELFSYPLANPVDLARHRSAMLPIVSADITAEKVSIYNQNTLAKHPLNGTLLTNTTGLKLMGGPVTVFDDGAYAGDAQIDSLEPNAVKLISYAIDLDVTVDPSLVHPPRKITGATIVSGVLHVVRLTTYQHTYRIQNKADSERTLIVEHPFVSANRKLVEPKTPMEKTATVYRFKVPVKAASVGDFVVKEEEPNDETIAILTFPVEPLASYRDNSGEIPEAVRKALAQAVDLKNALADAERKLGELTDELSRIKGGQDRLREDMKTVGKDSPLGSRYQNKLAEQEDRIEELEGKKGQQGLIDQARKDVLDKRKALEDYLKTLTVK
jgi:hypothetical protein